MRQPRRSRITIWQDLPMLAESLGEEELIGSIPRATVLFVKDITPDAEDPEKVTDALIADKSAIYLGLLLTLAEPTNTDSQDEFVAQTARFNFMSAGLPVLRRIYLLQFPEFETLTQETLNFLVEQRDRLRAFSQRIKEYLLLMHDRWYTTPPSDAQPSTIVTYHKLRERETTEAFVMACCTWELGYLFEKEGTPKEVAMYLEMFLELRGYNPKQALRTTLLMCDEKQTDRAMLFKNEAERQAAIAFLLLTAEENTASATDKPRGVAEVVAVKAYLKA